MSEEDDDGTYRPPPERRNRSYGTLLERLARLEERQAQNRLDINRFYKILAWFGGIVGTSIVLSILSQVLRTAGSATGLLP